MKQVILTASVKEGIETHSKLIGNRSDFVKTIETEEDYRSYLDKTNYYTLWDYCVEDIDHALSEHKYQVLVQIGDRYYETRNDIRPF